jgi:hypothetical protein
MSARFTVLEDQYRRLPPRGANDLGGTPLGDQGQSPLVGEAINFN